MQEIFGLPDGYWDQYREDISNVRSQDVLSLSSSLMDPSSAIIVVAGDAKVISHPLRVFGNVSILDPTKDFSRVSELQKLISPAASF